jgi:acetylglutamate kinase
MTRLGKESVFVDGLRVTDAETVDIVRMALVGKVNREVVGAINRHGPYAIGLSGEDASLVTVRQRDPRLGFVGDVTRINTNVLDRQIAEEFIPVIATIGVDEDGQIYNVNADTVAGAIAEALGAEKLVYLTNVPGLYGDLHDEDTLISQISASDLATMLADGSLSEGMVPKIRSCVSALRNGVGRAHLLDGRIPHALLLECFTHQGVGTMVVP